MARIIQYAVTELSGTESNDDDTLQEKHVIVTDVPVDIEWISRHPQTPKLNTEYRAHPGFWWNAITPRRISRRAWELDCRASTFSFPPLPDSPLDEPADITIDSELETEPTLFDWKDRPIVTTAGEWLAGVTRKRPTLVYRCEKNLPSDPGWLESHVGAMNSDAVRIRGRLRPPRTLLLARASMGPYQTKNKVRFSRVSFELHYRRDTWVQKFWNAGTLRLKAYLDDKNKTRYRQERIMTGNPRQPVDAPVPLDSRGAPIVGALDPNSSTPLDPRQLITLEVQTEIEAPFSGVLPLN